uniref:Uncharacterized protein n=1 Tax=Rhizophora mucronata TaxID=61149 RepID=A0A2P2LR18_RHIMU
MHKSSSLGLEVSTS